MVIYKKNSSLHWNFTKLLFVYPPEVFTGTFQNPKMEARNKALLEKKKSALLSHLENSSNPYEAMLTLHNNDHVQFLLNNIEIFKEDGCYEKAVVKLYYSKNTSFVIFGNYSIWKYLFQQCDPQLLYNSGHPFPHEIITAYRGSVTGNKTGLSWTINRDEVKWFLERWQDKNLGGGTIFALEIRKKDVMFYLETNNRQEVILFPEVAENANIYETDHL